MIYEETYIFNICVAAILELRHHGDTKLSNIIITELYTTK